MKTRRNLFVIFLLLFIPVFAGIAKEPKKSDIVRDGSSEERAILVPVSEAKSHDWQIAYLKRHFPEHYSFSGPISNLNEEHAFIGHDEKRRWYDYYSFTVAGKKREVYFDVSKQTLEWAKAHGLAK